MRKSEKINLKKVYILVAFIFILLFWLSNHKPSENGASKNGKDLKYSVDSASSIWAVVNKGRKLPSTYIPSPLVVPNVSLRLDPSAPEMEMRADAAAALEKLVNGAASDGQQLMLASGYRSYDTQVGLYNYYVDNDSRANADAYSARPGYSEHQTGLAVDMEAQNRVCELHQCFSNTAEGKWLAANSYKYGFIIRYPEGKDKLTGYEFEPWHIRFVGAELARKIHSSGQTLEQAFSLPNYSDYSRSFVILRN